MRERHLVLLKEEEHFQMIYMDDERSYVSYLVSDVQEYMDAEGRAILISSHISSDLEGFCDDIYMIDRGQIVLHEETDVLTDEYGLLKVSEEQYEELDKEYILRYRKESFGYSVLTGQKQFYQENYPDIVIEKGNIDELIMMMIRGERR